MDKELIKLNNICKSYTVSDTKTDILNNLNFTINEGDFISIMGASGSGKSTLMNIIGLLDRIDSGSYLYMGKNIENISSNEQASLRNKVIGFIFQSFFLLPRLTVLQNVLLPFTYRDKQYMEKGIESAKSILDKVGLYEKINHYPNQLSGGQQQRVAIARALVGEPKLILADEPTGALDQKTSREVLDLFIDLSLQNKRTLIIITHDPLVAKESNIQFLMQSGNLVKS